MAVLDLFPGTDLGFGPATEDGFYYDFRHPAPLPGGRPPADRGADEGDRRASGGPTAGCECDRAAAKARLAQVGYALKIPHVDEIPEEAISFYDSGAVHRHVRGAARPRHLVARRT